MAVSLEARVPFLDPNLVALAWSLPRNLKIKQGKGKWVLREVLARYVPSALTNRPKSGFAVPVADWLRGPLKEWASALLDGDRIEREGVLYRAPIEAAWHEHLSGRFDRQRLLWPVLMFQSWLEIETSVQ